MKKGLFLLTISTMFLMYSFMTIEKNTKQENKAFTAEEIEFMMTADKVEAYRLDKETVDFWGQVTPESIPSTMSLEEQTLLNQKDALTKNKLKKTFVTSVSKKEVKRLKKLVTVAKNPTTKPTTECNYQPGVGLKFYKGGERFYVLLCLNCNVWGYERRECMYYVEFEDDMRDEIVNYAKRLFPKDKAIQAIK